MARKRLTREQQKAETRKHLIESMRKVVTRRGFHDASIEEVAEEAGYSRGAVYSNFGSKEDLFFAGFDEKLEQWQSKIEEIADTGGDPLAQADEWGRIFDFMFGENLEWYVAFTEFCCKAAKRPKLRKKVAARQMMMQKTLAKIMKAQSEVLGLPFPAPAEQLAVAVLALSFGFAQRRLIDPEAFPIELHQTILGNYFVGVFALSREMMTSKQNSGD